MTRHLLATLLAAAVLGVAGCGDEDPEPSIGGAPAVTIGDQPYEDGGADGSGADGAEKANPRGGIAGGHDEPEPTDRPDGDEQPEQPAQEQ